jgi:hypothetical protein
MSALLLAVLLQAEGIEIERNVQLTVIDLLGREREIRRRERVLVRGSDLLVEDLTFGGRLLIRPGLKKVWRSDPLAGTVSELGFDDVAALRARALDELAACRARVAGSAEDAALGAVLEGLDRFAAEPRVELKADGNRRELVLNGDRVKASVEVDPARSAPGWFEALGAIGAFPPATLAKLKELGGLPLKGTLRYALFLDRVVERFETTSVMARPMADADFAPPEGLRKIPMASLEPPIERRPAVPAPAKRDFRLDDGEKKDRESEGKQNP